MKMDYEENSSMDLLYLKDFVMHREEWK